LHLGTLGIGIYLLRMCDSKTSLVCLLIGGSLLLSSRIPWCRRRTALLSNLAIWIPVGVLTLDWIFGIKKAFLELLGRDATLTGRTDVWRELLNLHTDPVFGTGFCNLWSDDQLTAQLPDWANNGSAHNGYLEVYLDGGFVGVALLAILLVSALFRLRRLVAAEGSNYAMLRFSVVIVALFSNMSEGQFIRMSPMWFLLIASGINYKQIVLQQQQI
jgi:exopolysaccharide production protein ExoQ